MKFDEWFTLQFGMRPSYKTLFELKDEAKSMALEADKAKDMYNKVEQWEILRNATRYAWNVDDKGKK